jgi:spermidine synthase
VRSLAVPDIALVNLGFAAGVTQAVLLREAMAALGGSELAWGAVLAAWLAGMGLGAWLGVRRPAGRVAAAIPVVVLLLAGAGVVMLRALPVLVGAEAGESGTTWRGAWVWLAAVLPAATAGGWAFPALVRLGETRAGAGLAYALEGGGTLLGGFAFTFLLAPFGSAAALTVAAGATAALVLAVHRRPVAAALIVVVAAAATVPATRGLAALGWRLSGRVGSLADWRETAQQRLELAATTPASLYGDGRLLATFPDPYRVAPRAHLALLLHPRPRRVLGVGVLADGSLEALLQHPVERIDVVEEDPALVRVVPAWFGPRLAAALADPRVVVHRTDPLRVVGRGGPWDVVLLLDGDPVTLRHGRTRTVEFFRACAAALAPDGIVIVRVGVGDTYLGGAGGRLLAVLAATLRSALPAVTAAPGEEVLLVGSRAPVALDAAVLTGRLEARRLGDGAMSAGLIEVMLDPSRQGPVATFVAAAPGPLSRAAHPRATALAAALAEGRGNPPLLRAVAALESRPATPLLLLLLAAAIAVPLRAAAGARLGVETAALVGLCSMGWWLLLLSCWQSTVGAVYAEIGALSGAFMGGSVVGAALARRRALGRHHLAALFAVGSALSLAIAAGVPLAAPRSTVVPLLVLAGALTGAAFPAVASRLAPDDARSGAGRGFAADEIGAAGGALLLGLVAIPWAGMPAVAGGLALLTAVTAATLWLAGRSGA